MKQPSIGDDQPHHPSKAESLQVLPIALEILLGLGPEDPMGRQEFIERAARVPKPSSRRSSGRVR